MARARVNGAAKWVAVILTAVALAAGVGRSHSSQAASTVRLEERGIAMKESLVRIEATLGAVASRLGALEQAVAALK